MKNLIKKIFTIIPLAIFILNIFVTTSFTELGVADTIKLKNGRSITGKLKEINEENVVLEIKLGGSEGSVWFRKEEVESINSLSLEEAKARLITREAFLLGDKKTMIISSAKEGLNFVAKTRRLEFKNTPEIEIVSKGALKTNLKKSIEKNYSKEKLETRAKLLLKLGLISKIEEYTKTVLDLFVEEVAGYYDPEYKKIYVTDEDFTYVMPGLPSITIMHEQVHALQDQYFDLKGAQDRLIQEDNEDGALAFQSIVEGEATVLMYDAFLRSMGAQDKAKEGFDIRSFAIDSMLAYSKRVKTKDGKPAIFVEDLLFPYVWGGTFIQHLVNTQGWQAVDSIYKDMPSSSEQIMHPEKYYISRDQPQKVVIPDLSNVLGSSWLKITQNSSGEFGFYLISKAFLDDLSSKMLSEGWGGDYFALYEEPNLKRLLLVSKSKWDTEKDAEEFFGMYKQVIQKKYKQESLVKEEANFSHWKTEEGNIHMTKYKDTVTIIEGATDETLEALIKSSAS